MHVLSTMPSGRDHRVNIVQRPAGRRSFDMRTQQMVQRRGRLCRQPGVHIRRLDDRRGRCDEPAEALGRRQPRERAATGIAARDAGQGCQARAHGLRVQTGCQCRQPCLVDVRAHVEVVVLATNTTTPTLTRSNLPEGLARSRRRGRRALVLRPRQPRDRLDPARVHRLLAGHDAVNRARQRAPVRRTARAFGDRTGGGH